ncbi:jg27653, partial [Pararge aegeria aegeria]
MGRRKRSKRSHHNSGKRRRRQDDTTSESSDSSGPRDRSPRRNSRDRLTVYRSRNQRSTSKRTAATPELCDVVSATGRVGTCTDGEGRNIVRSRNSATGRDTLQMPLEQTSDGAAAQAPGCLPEVATDPAASAAITDDATDAAAAAKGIFAGHQAQVPHSGTSGQCNTTTIPNSFLSSSDFAQLLQSFVKPGLSSSINTNVINMIPEFDPSIKNHRIDLWLSKVNECAKIYRWDEAHIMHYALPKLVGNAKKWYQGQTSVLREWKEWQVLLRKAFPTETNYGVLLSEMLERRLKFGENLDEYYYEKIMLLNACEISGKRAVDCIIHGIDDRMVRAGASSGRFTEPEDLFKFLKDVCKEQKDIIRNSNLNKTRQIINCNRCNEPGHRAALCRAINPQLNQTTVVTCFNCRDRGHRIQQCPKPIIKCEGCHRFGHKSDDCYLKNNAKNNEKRVLFVDSKKSNNLKYYKQAVVNNCSFIQCFVDLGSDCTLITKETVEKFGLQLSKECIPSIRGVADVVIPILGKTSFSLRIDSVEANITAYVIDNRHLHVPLLVGQNFTELPDIVITKTENSFNILSRNSIPELPNINEDCFNSRKIKLIVLSDTKIRTVDLLHCYSTDLRDANIYVPSNYRNVNGQEYCIQGGVYQIKHGKCDLLIFNMDNTEDPQPLYFIKDLLIARAVAIDNDSSSLKCPEEHLQCLTTHTLNPLDRNDILINPDISDKQKETVYNLINEYRECFAQNLSELGCTNISELDIKLTDDNPVAYRPYRLSHSEKEIVRDMVKELEENKIIEESDSAYASPILLVSKKTGGYRLCVDYRALNRKTIRDLYPLPRIDDQIDLLSGNSYFISLDMSSGYYQIPIKEDCKHLTAFITPDGLYQFRRAPFGLANCPAVFQRTVNKMLGNSREKCAIAYMDDLLISGKNFDECLSKLEQTFILLKKAALTLNIKKCRFFDTTINYLGFEISAEGVRPGQTKINAVISFPEPKNVHEIRQFMGLASYFRKFIEHFATIARPLTDLTKQNNPWKWEQPQRAAFKTLKEKLTQRPILAIYNTAYITELHCDASKVGLGGILFQKESPNSCLKPVAYFSRKTTIDEEKLHAYELETLAVVASLSRFRV